jgi:hypothetical protein
MCRKRHFLYDAGDDALDTLTSFELQSKTVQMNSINLTAVYVFVNNNCVLPIHLSRCA